MPKITKRELDQLVRKFNELVGFSVTLKDIPGDYGLVVFNPEASPPVYEPLSPSFATRDELLVWMQGFVAGWRTANVP